ncbi:MAG: Clp protease ClpP [Rhodobacteraceae bacterium]|nr:Clp protease ClpP [Paracoccaceae bacterium]
MASWYAIRARGTGAEVAIYDEIGAYGVSAKGFLAELGALPEGTPVDLRLNSPGGSVFDAVAIHNALKRHAGPVTVWVDGIAASAASYIAMAGDEIVMPENAFLMIHDPAGLVMGTAEDMRAMAEALDKVKGSLVSGYAAKSGRTTEEVSGLMSAETWFDASDAVAQGFADRLIEPVRIAARFDIGRFRNAPPVLIEAVEADPDPDGAEIEADEETDGDAEGDQLSDADDEQAAAPGVPQPPANSPPPSGAPPDPAAIRSEAIGMPARWSISAVSRASRRWAGRFLEEDASLDAVRAALLAAKAEAEPEIAPITRSPAAPRPRAPGRGRRPHLQAERMTP